MKTDNLKFLLVFSIFFLILLFVFKTDFRIQINLIPVDLKYDTLLNFIGNLLIALYIASIITKKQKNQELRIDNCFKELDCLLNLINELRSSLNDNSNSTNDSGILQTKEDDIRRYLSLISLQIELIKKYEFISHDFKDKLFAEYYIFDGHLTGSDEINFEYKHSALQLERIILNIKSNIL